MGLVLTCGRLSYLSKRRGLPMRCRRYFPWPAGPTMLKRDGDTVAIEADLATFNDHEEAVDTRRWRKLEHRYRRDV